MNPEYINKLSEKIYQQNVEMGWWDDPDRCVYQTLQLVSTEVSEATEGSRKNLMDDHLPQYKMEVVELADAMIRMLDFGGRYELTYTPTGAESPIMGREVSAGANHLGINLALCDFVKAWFLEKEKETLDTFYSAVIDMILNCAANRGYNIALALNDKLSYNSRRPDHKKENREKTGGKKF